MSDENVPACEITGKVKYASQAAASKARASFRTRPSAWARKKGRRMPKASTHGELQVYRCRYCNGWHLGRQMRGRTRGKGT